MGTVGGFTPTADQVRWRYQAIAKDEAAAVFEFDRWLVSVEREAEARGLERLLDAVTEPGLVQVFGGEKFVSVALLVSEARAQQVREGTPPDSGSDQ